jgi:L-alanine-DL-glutamate epimerase-like enolase superfamily enzyme
MGLRWGMPAGTSINARVAASSVGRPRAGLLGGFDPDRSGGGRGASARGPRWGFSPDRQSFALKPLAWELSSNHILPDEGGEIALPEAPGLGIEIDKAALQKYLVPVEIAVKGRTLYRSPPLD